MELIDCPLPYPDHGLVCLTDNSPVLFYQIGTHETRVLVDIPENTPTAAHTPPVGSNHIFKMSYYLHFQTSPNPLSKPLSKKALSVACRTHTYLPPQIAPQV